MSYYGIKAARTTIEVLGFLVRFAIGCEKRVTLEGSEVR